MSISVLLIVAAFWNQAPPEPLLVFEGGPARDVRIKDDTIALLPGPGWLRTRRPYSDFILSFEYRIAEPQGDAGVAVRTWPLGDGWPRVGYAVPLAGPGNIELRPRRADAAVIESSRAPAPIDSEWHRVTVTCVGDRVTVGVDRQHAGTYKVAEPSGAILFYARRRTLELRNITVREVPGREPVLRLRKSNDGSVEMPRVAREVRPIYPRAVMTRHVEGAVLLEAVVLEDGSVGPISVIQSLDPVLDMAAAFALSRWRFIPAMRNGKPVRVFVEVELAFKLR